MRLDGARLLMQREVMRGLSKARAVTDH